MKWKTGLAALFVTSALLAACGTDEATEDQGQEEAQKGNIDLAAENEFIRLYALDQMPAFIEDADMLANFIKEGKLEEAQKLFPLVTMYYERLQPVMPAFSNLNKEIAGVADDAAKSTGFAKLAHGLYEEQVTKGYDKAAEKLVADVRKLEKELTAKKLDTYNVLENAKKMLNETINNRLTTNSLADAEIYMVKAQTEMIEELVRNYMNRSEASAAAEVVQATVALNEVVSFYEVGKEDYVKYSLFTSSQKTELIDAVKNVQKAFDHMVSTVK